MNSYNSHDIGPGGIAKYWGVVFCRLTDTKLKSYTGFFLIWHFQQPEPGMSTEIFDIVDEDDQIIGQATRDQVHGQPDLIHRVAHVLVFNSRRELYLQKRGLNKDVQPGKWDTSVGGHVDRGESYREAAMREMKEELGIHPGQIRFLYKYQHSNDFESEYVSTYTCTWDSIIQVNKSEIEEGRFWEIDKILRQSESGVFTPNFLDELARYLDHIE